MKKILIRTMGGKSIGYGHFYRCLSLHKAISLVTKNYNPMFVINDELEELINALEYEYIVSNDFKEDINLIKKLGNVELYILDSYLVDNEFLRNIKEHTKLMLIDDNNDIYDLTIPDIIYNGNIHAKELNYKKIENQLQLLGLEYLIMKEEYWENNDEAKIKEGILITTGGTDNFDLMYNMLNELKDTIIPIRCIIGPGYTKDYIEKIETNKNDNMELIYSPNSLKEYIALSKVAITTGSSTVYEVLSQKTLPIIYSVADNQDMICESLRNKGAAYIGKYPDIDYKGLKSIIEKTIIQT